MTEILSLIFAASSAWILGVGFLIGLQHATEADHLAAVSTIVTERKSLLGSALVGGLWGLGHTISLLVAGIVVLLLNFQISEKLESALEFCVGIMLVLLGLNVLRKILQRDELHSHNEHSGHDHAYSHNHAINPDESQPHRGFSFSPRALIVGMVHGLAGSAALTLLILQTIQSKTVGLIYIIIFGVGSIGGMMLMSFLVGLPFHFTTSRINGLNLLLRCIAGLFSVGWGIKVMFDKGVSDGLFT